MRSRVLRAERVMRVDAQQPVAAVPSDATGSQDNPNPRLRLNVLGRQDLTLGTGPAATDVHIRRSDGIQILAYLATHPDGASSDTPMATLWPDTRPRYARGRFHTTLSELRRILSDATGAEAIIRAGERYRPDPDHIEVDLWELTAAARTAATTLDPAEHRRALQQVTDLYTGLLADGQTWAWLEPCREQVRRLVLDAYLALADVEDDPATALALVQRAIGIDPYHEDAYQRAMRLHAALGNADGVTRTLRALTQRLADLNIAPRADTQQLAHEMRTINGATPRR